jgi:hypothetical protein
MVAGEMSDRAARRLLPTQWQGLAGNGSSSIQSPLTFFYRTMAAREAPFIISQHILVMVS